MSARSFTLNKRRQGNITVKRTNVDGEGEQVMIILHSTAVITKQPGGEIILSTGGWRTVTTKTAINRGLELLGIKAHVSQRKGNWYVTVNGMEIEWKERTFHIKTWLENFLDGASA